MKPPKFEIRRFFIWRSRYPCSYI